MIPKTLYQNQTVHYNLTHCPQDGALSCGFLWKPEAFHSQRDIIFEQYGAFLLLDGSGYYSDSEGFEFELKPGAYVQRLPGRVHTTLVEPDEQWLEFFLCFGERTYNTLKAVELITDTPVIYPGATPETLQHCRYLMELFQHADESKMSTLYLAAQEFAVEMFHYARSGGQEMNAEDMLQIKRAKELLCENKPRFLNACEVAQQIGMPYERFRKKFRTYCGISPGEYQLNSRINYSKTLLLDTKKNLNEIALRCGFSDGFAYSKAFKKRCQMSPSEFRLKLLTL